MSKGRKPDYKVSALNKSTNQRGGVGAAWVNQDRTITVILDPFVVLNSNNLLITLFPSDMPFKTKYQEAAEQLPENVSS